MDVEWHWRRRWKVAGSSGNRSRKAVIVGKRPSRCVIFYTEVAGIRVELMRVGNGKWTIEEPHCWPKPAGASLPAMMKRALKEARRVAEYAREAAERELQACEARVAALASIDALPVPTEETAKRGRIEKKTTLREARKGW